MPNVFKDDFSKNIEKSTYKGGVRGVKGAKDFRRGMSAFYRQNPTLSNKLATKGITSRGQYLSYFRKAVDFLRDRGVNMRKSRAGGNLKSSQGAKTRQASYTDWAKAKEPKESGVSQKRIRVINFMNAQERQREADAKSGAQREALDSRKTAVVSIYQKTNKNNKPTASISQQMNQNRRASVSKPLRSFSASQAGEEKPKESEKPEEPIELQI